MKEAVRRFLFSNTLFMDWYAWVINVRFNLKIKKSEIGDPLDRPLAENTKSILFLIPHYDDEVLSAYYLLKQESQHKHIDLLYISDGKNCLTSKFSSDIEHARKKESQNALEHLSFRSVEYLSLPDGFLDGHRHALEKELDQRVNSGFYDAILSPAPSDKTPDHATIADTLDRILNSDSPEVLYYRSTWSTFPIEEADYIYSGPLEAKRIALSHFHTQRNIPLLNTLLFSMNESNHMSPSEGFIRRERFLDRTFKFEVTNMLNA